MTPEPKPSLESLVNKFNKNRQIFYPAFLSIEEVESLRNDFVNDFPKNSIFYLTLEQYAEGFIDNTTGQKKEDSFSHRIAYKMIPFGSIQNPSGLYTHEIFIRKDTQEADYRKSRYSSANEAFIKTKNSLVKLLDAGEKMDIQKIEENTLHPFLKSKILCIYFPDHYLNLHNMPVCKQLALELDLYDKQSIGHKSMFEIQQKLLEFKSDTPKLRYLKNFDYGHVLWIYYQGEKSSDRKHQKYLLAYLDNLSQYGISQTHIQVLKKFFSTRGKYLPPNQIYGYWSQTGKRTKLPVGPDDLVDKPHYMHNLITGVYTPKGGEYAQSISLNPKSKWALEIDRESPTLKINYDFEDREKYNSQIKRLRNCYKQDVPFGILISVSRGKIKSLGLGRVVSDEGTKFTIESYAISDIESAKLKDETLEEFDDTQTDPDYAKIDDIDYLDLLDSVDLEQQQSKLRYPKELGSGRAHVSQIIDYCETGEWVIPIFQRYFNWGKGDIRDFLKSIFLGYYVGSLLLWDIRREEELDVMVVRGVQESADLKKNAIVLDGQQRITSLYYAVKTPDFSLRGSSKPSYFYINLVDFLKEDDSENLIRTFSEKLDRSDCYRKMLFPFYELDNYQDWLYGFDKYLREQNLDEEKIHSIFEIVGRKLNSIFSNVEIPYVTLSDEMTIDQVTEIFEKINSTGIQLDVFDLLIARLSKYKINLRDLWKKSRKVGKVSQYYSNGKGILKLPIYILESISLAYTSSGSCKRKDILNIYNNLGQKEQQAFEEKWDEMTQFTVEAIDLLENTKDGFGVTGRVIPFEPMIPVLASLLKEIKTSKILKNKTKKCFDKLTNWYWASVFSNAYSSSADSQKTSDHKEMITWLEDDKAIPKGIAKFRFNFQNLDLKSVIHKANAIHRGVLCLVALKGGNDLDNNRSVANGQYQQDHIFPKSKFSQSPHINSILNITWLTKDTNSRIKRAKIPSEFTRETIDQKYDGSEDEFKRTLETHFISEESYDHLKNDEFDKFLDSRLETILQAIGEKIGSTIEKPFTSVMVSPEQPYTAKRKLFRSALDTCDEYVWWVDKYFKKKGFEFLIELREHHSISEIKILLSVESAEHDLRTEFKEFVEEMNNSGKEAYMRIIVDSKTIQEFHDRWIISRHSCYNVPSIDVAMRKQLSEFKKTNNRPPFEKWWANSLDIVDDWNSIWQIKSRLPTR